MLHVDKVPGLQIAKYNVRENEVKGLSQASSFKVMFYPKHVRSLSGGIEIKVKKPYLRGLKDVLIQYSQAYRIAFGFESEEL